MTDHEKLRALIPENTKKHLDPNEHIYPINGRALFSNILDDPVIIMACNTRIIHNTPGIMRAAKELDAIVGFELARTEVGYTAQTPEQFVEMLLGYARKENFDKPFFIHGDHTSVKDTSEAEFNAAHDLIIAEHKAGYTSIAIDASHNELPDNIAITKKLARMINDWGLGLEVEVGEIAGAKGELTTLAEAVEYITALVDVDIHPNLLAISNGSKHGNYKPGEEVHIDLPRTGEIYEAIRPHGVAIAQHGITGTPMDMVGTFADYGVRKGNVGTNWQNIAHRHFPQDLMERMKKWTANHNEAIKRATAPFKEEVDNIPLENQKAIWEESYESAKEFIRAFRADGSASLLLKKLDK